MKVRGLDVFRVATELFEQDPDWVTFFREVLGIEGIIRQVYRTPEALGEFERTEEYAQIKQMLAELRRRSEERQPARESQRVITVRMPQSLHESLKGEAQKLDMSINQLCIAKLMKYIDAQLDLPRRSPARRPQLQEEKEEELEVDQ